MTTLFSLAAQVADVRDRERIERAEEGKGANRGSLRPQRNVQFHDRLVRASLDLKSRQSITEVLKALVVACPDVLLDQAYQLAWGSGRAGRGVPPPPLLERYKQELKAGDFKFDGSGTIESDIGRAGPIREVLLCHGLSPAPDTILLLADIGRAARISHSLGLNEVHVMLADVTWMKHNRSVLGRFKNEDEYSDQLRICQDNRLRIYKALGLKCDVFSISPNQGSTSISRPRLQSASEAHRQLAEALWGSRVLEPHDVNTKTLIGQSFANMRPHHLELLPPHMQTMLKFPGFARALEDALKGQLSILRAVSELFSAFDTDIFVYYVAQFYAQNAYRQFLKVAVHSELKFDCYYDEFNVHFAHFVVDGVATQGTMKGRRHAQLPRRRYMYFPQYRLADLEVLPYTSLSLDVNKSKEPLPDLLNRLILLRDCGEETRDKHLEKIGRVLRLTPLAARNRLISDLLSFAHLLVSRVRIEANPASALAASITSLGRRIHDDIYSNAYELTDYPRLFSEWLTAIDQPHHVLPFHLKPYTWDEERWSDQMVENAAVFIFELLTATRRICD
jgi:hypothetical protein